MPRSVTATLTIFTNDSPGSCTLTGLLPTLGTLATVIVEWDPTLDGVVDKGHGESIVPTGATPNVQIAMPKKQMDFLLGRPARSLVNLTYTGSTIQSATFS